MAMTGRDPLLRRTRFVCISDTHNGTPHGSFKLPKGDVLIHAGDLTNQGSLTELQRTVKWIEEADFEAKIVVAGNHDITLDSDFYAQYGSYFHNQHPQDPSLCQKLLDESTSILWLKDESATVDLQSPTGPRTTFKIFGSGMSPASGMWAFGYNADQASPLWKRIPLDTDILVTHTPPKFHCDERKDRRAVGCEVLRQVLWRVRPRLHICGHVHESRGVDRITWDLGAPNIKYKEAGVERWQDPGYDNNKLSLLDLTRRSGKPINNDGAPGDYILPPKDIWPTDSTSSTSSPTPSKNLSSGSSQLGYSSQVSDVAFSGHDLIETVHGQGGTPPSRRCDLEALSGRMGRKETCVVNAALMASSWPHGKGGKKFNKPIVVDIDLPTWES